MKKRNLLVLFICLVVVYFVAFLGSIFTSSEVNSQWYQAIKPEITPPNYIFPIVWNILFLLIGLSLYYSWMSGKNKMKIMFVFGINFALNILWSVLYFGLHNVFLAFIDAIILWFSILLMMIVTYSVERKASYLLLPYLLWVSFAIVLTYFSLA